jgi:hypothetical protein
LCHCVCVQQVPGDIITDLNNAGVLPDPYWNVSWRDESFIAAWNAGRWTYTRKFAWPQRPVLHGRQQPQPQQQSHGDSGGGDTIGGGGGGGGLTAASAASGDDVLLVFDGIRMGAIITLNGHVLGNATDQFLRYTFPVGSLLTQDGSTLNVLEVTFDKTIACGGRFTYSSQIDWAPAMATFDPTAHGKDAQQIEGRETFGFGIWKSVYLTSVPSGAAAITHFLPHTFYAGGHPTSILSDDNHSGFDIRARVEMWSPVKTSGVVQVSVLGVAGASVSSHVSVAAGYVHVTLTTHKHSLDRSNQHALLLLVCTSKINCTAVERGQRPGGGGVDFYGLDQNRHKFYSV